jgi:hypothetical protein
VHDKSFADVRAALERILPPLDHSIMKALTEGDVKRVARGEKEGPELSIFQAISTALPTRFVPCRPM